MYCRVATTQFNSSDLNDESLDKATQVWLQKGVPLLKSQKGFRSLEIMGNRQTGKALVITTWDSKEDSDAAASQPERSEFNQHVAAALGITIPPPTVEEYQITIHEHA